MQISKLLTILVLCGTFALLGLTGCNGELKDCRIQNQRQSQHIHDLESELQAAKLQLDQLNRELGSAESRGDVTIDSLKKKITALQNAIREKEQLIASMQEQIMHGVAMPLPLRTKLEEFAKQHEMVTFDPDRGIVKFKSDLLFEKGSDQVNADAKKAIEALADILKSEEAKQFDIVIAGHTDDIPIRRPATLAAHPSNWHLSAHRGISVLKVLEAKGVPSERISARGFGEYRPVAANKPNKGGNPQNRRVEIYMVPQGM